MNYRLLEFLACPHDRYFPLVLEKQKEAKTNKRLKTVCQTYCGYRQQELNGKDNLEGCQDCQQLEIITGTLFCPQCGQSFTIKQGLPQLLPDYQRLAANEEIVQIKQQEVKSRNQQAFNYDQLFFLKLLSKLEVPAVLSLLDPKEGETVLELGAGTGRLTQLIAQKSEVVAVDYSASSLKLGWLKAQAHPVHFVMADINHLPFKAQAFTKAVSCQVFEHIPTAVRQHALEEVRRVLKQKGSFTLTVYRDSWFWRLFGPKEGFHDGGIYYYRFTPAEFKAFLSSAFMVERFISNLGFYLLAARGRSFPRTCCQTPI